MPKTNWLTLGIQAESGDALPEITSHGLTELINRAASHSAIHKKVSLPVGHPSIPRHLDNPNDLSQTGWAVLYGSSVSAEIKNQLKLLIDHRREESRDDTIFQILGDAAEDATYGRDTSYKTGMTAAQWLWQVNGISVGEVDPSAGVPYYVMIVASPEEISFDFQADLDLFWAVGRVWFPTPEEFAQYAHSVVRYEKGLNPVQTSKQIAIFGTRNPGDAATAIVCDSLIKPMINGEFDAFGHQTRPPLGVAEHFKLLPFIEAAATREALTNIIAGAIPGGTPALLFTGSHGMNFNPRDRRFAARQGGVVTQEWPGNAPPTEDQYFHGDLPEVKDAKVHGMVHFLFACYGGGWPEYDTYSHGPSPVPIAERPALARLPQRLMAQRSGYGALAVFAHIDRAWTNSFQEKGVGQLGGFRGVTQRIMNGNRLGLATEAFSQRWANLSISVNKLLSGKTEQLARLEGIEAAAEEHHFTDALISRDDAKNYILLGDPAVFLRVKEMPDML